MGLFKNNYNKPGPGVPKNAPKKKGFARFWEVFLRDFSDLLKMNTWVELCCLPSQLALGAGFFCLVIGQGTLFLLFGGLALLCSVLVLPAFTAQSYILVRRLRDDPCFVWDDFKRVYKENFRSLIVPGLFYGLIIGSQNLVLFYIIGTGVLPNGILLGFYLLSTLVFSLALPYFFIQKAYLDLSYPALLKNSLFLGLSYFPRSIAAALLHGLLSATWVTLFAPVFIPLILIYMFLLGHFLPNLISTMFVWPQIDKTFNIDETLKKRADEKLDNMDKIST